MESGNEERMAGRPAVASSEEEKVHEEIRMRDVHNGETRWQKATQGSLDSVFLEYFIF